MPAYNFTLISQLAPETIANNSGDQYSGCWGWYQESTKKEYAIICSHRGTYFIDITDPAIPVVADFEKGLRSSTTWRETKTYKNYCYVISDAGGPNSLQIFDLSSLPDSVRKVHDADSVFSRGHALWIDHDKMFVASVTTTDNAFSSMNVYGLSDPENPALIRRLNQDFPFISLVHDMYPRNDTVYASCGYQGLHIFRLNADSSFSQLGSLTTYPGSGYNHSSALTPDGKTLVFTDEIPSSLPFKIADVTNFSNIQILATTQQYSLTTPHNPFIVNKQYCFMSSYQDGIQLYDISSPSQPSLVAWFDTYDAGGANTGSYGSTAFNGNWGAYPYFPSRNIVCLDQNNGMFLLKTHLYENPLTGLNELNNSGFIFYPQPTDKYLMISGVAGGNYQLRIRTMFSQLIFETELNDSSSAIDISSVPDGIYVTEMISENRIILSKKLLIKH